MYVLYYVDSMYSTQPRVDTYVWASSAAEHKAARDRLHFSLALRLHRSAEKVKQTMRGQGAGLACGPKPVCGYLSCVSSGDSHTRVA